jgi:hypothetical protein
MVSHCRFALVPSIALPLIFLAQAAPGEPVYVKKESRVGTIVASLAKSKLPNLEGAWHYIGPFDNTDNLGFAAAYPPEREIDLKKTYFGKDETKVAWKKFEGFRVGHIVDLKKFKQSDHCVIYLFHEIDAPQAMTMPISLGSDDSLKVFLNGKQILADDAVRGAVPDQNAVELKLKKGKNQLLIKVGNVAGDWAVYIAPEFPKDFPRAFRKKLAADFQKPGTTNVNSSAEAAHYRIVTLPIPNDIVLEVGGLAFRKDGKLLACTRRGDVWLIANPGSDDPEEIKYKKFATGLHEALGLLVDGKDVFVVQRPELTRLRATTGNDEADEYTTVCDKWGVSGDYHEFAFGPARDKKGNFFITLNVGFGWGHQAKTPWRGWCVKVSPDGKLTPWATGLRSPNGINFSPDGDLFYCDNQGEWVATNKMHHIRKGDNYGHQAGLVWVKESPFAQQLKLSYPSGMLYDGQKGTQRSGMPPHDPPCIWFPYGRMGQSASEPIWDTTGGKFGPFAGQCFVGDQTKSNVMRVYLEKVNGKYQGACFPFRSGFQCGINRLAFGPDNNLYAGQTNRGWGSVGGKPFGLQRLAYTGVLPFEIHSMKLTKTGFDLTFTKPVGVKTADRLAAYSLLSFTYNYWSNYGSNEIDRRAQKVESVKISADGKKVSLGVSGFKKGRVYELKLEGIKSAAGDAVLHPEAYYTLNEIPE